MTMETQQLLAAATTLMSLTALVWLAMVITRLRAMQAKGIAPQAAAHTVDLAAVLPSSATRVSDNYNHLFESPTVFYMAVVVLALAGAANAWAVAAAWGYVALRVLHSLVQTTFNLVTVRFTLFTLSWLALCVLIACAAWAVQGAKP